MTQRNSVDLIKVAGENDQVSILADQLEDPRPDSTPKLYWPEPFAASGTGTSSCVTKVQVLRVAPE